MAVSAAHYPDFNSIVRNRYYAGYQFDHRLNDAIKLHSGLLYAWSDPNRLVESAGTGFVGGFTGPRRILKRSIAEFRVDWNSIAWDNNLLASFVTGPIRHELLVGFDYYRSKAVNFGRGATLGPSDLFAPTHGASATGP